ncbi:hypothetical protein [Paenibacillus sp. FSL H8-0259]|jgi:hypothetical protein|nr:hypothetical protein [Paenibacillus sp. FSL H8-0259]
MISECKAYYITSRKEEISGMGEASASVWGKMSGSVEHEAVGFGFNHI